MKSGKGYTEDISIQSKRSEEENEKKTCIIS